MLSSLLKADALIGEVAQRAPYLAATLQRFGAIPVDIRDADDGTLVLRGTLGSVLARKVQELLPGKYTAVVGSRPLSLSIPISIDSQHQISLDQLFELARRLGGFAERASAFAAVQIAAPRQGAASPETAGVLLSLQTMGASPIASPRPQATTMPLRVLASSVPILDGTSPNLLPTVVKIDKQSDSVVVSAPGRKTPTLVQFLRAGRATLNALLPTGASFLLRKRPAEQGLQVSLQFNEPFADGLVELRVSKDFGALDDAVSVASDPDRLLPYAEEHPGAATLAGYALLRSQNHAVVERALNVVRNQSDMEPDTTILFAECAARTTDRLAEALDGFLTAATLGVPCYSFGLSMLVERLRLFSQCEPGTNGLPADANIRAIKALERIAPFLLFADHTRIFTAYTGTKPEKPGAEPLAALAFSQAGGEFVQLND